MDYNLVEEADDDGLVDEILPFWGTIDRREIPKTIVPAAEPNRLILLADAYFGVVATVLYLPLMSQLGDEEENGDGGGGEEGEQSASFTTLTMWSNAVLVFMVIMYAYNLHSRMYAFIQGYNVILLLSNFFSLLLVGLIPFCSLLWVVSVNFTSDPSSHGEAAEQLKNEQSWVSFIEATLLLLIAFSFFLTWVAVKYTKVEWDVGLNHSEWIKLLVKLVCFQIGCALAMAFSFLIQRYALILVYVGTLLYRFIKNCFGPLLGFEKEDKINKKKVITQKVHLERLICLTDAVYAFSATLIVADLGLEGDNLAELEHGQLREVLHLKLPEVLGYIWCFVLLLMFWVIHDRLFCTLAKITPGMFWLSSLGLAVIPTLAFGCKLSMKNYIEDNINQRESLLFINGSMIWVAVAYLACGILISYTPEVVKPTHRHIIFHSSPTTKYWHVQFVFTCLGIITISLVALVISGFDFIETGLILSFCPPIYCIILNICAPDFLKSVDKANFIHLQEEHVRHANIHLHGEGGHANNHLHEEDEHEVSQSLLSIQSEGEMTSLLQGGGDSLSLNNIVENNAE